MHGSGYVPYLPAPGISALSWAKAPRTRNNRRPRKARQGPERLTVALHWITRRRRVALAQLLRGACYGVGTGVIGLAFVWMERLL